MEYTLVCEKCGKTFTASKPNVKLCYPCRMVYWSRPMGSDPYISVKIDKDTWLIKPIIHYFRRGKKTRFFPNPKWESAPIHVSMDVDKLTAKLSHMRPKITVKELTKLFQKAVTQGIFTPINEDNRIVKIGLTVDSWLKYKKPNEKSKWICVTPSQIQQVIKKQT